MVNNSKSNIIFQVKFTKPLSYGVCSNATIPRSNIKHWMKLIYVFCDLSEGPSGRDDNSIKLKLPKPG
jgi:hypothetical protein